MVAITALRTTRTDPFDGSNEPPISSPYLAKYPNILRQYTETILDSIELVSSYILAISAVQATVSSFQVASFNHSIIPASSNAI